MSEKNGQNVANRKMQGNKMPTNQTDMSNNDSETGRKKNGSLSKSTGKSQSRGNSNNIQSNKYQIQQNFADQVSNLGQNTPDQMAQNQIHMMGLPNMPQGDQYQGFGFITSAMSQAAPF